MGGAVPERARSRSDPTHDAIGQTFPQGQGTVIRGPPRSERNVQFMDTKTARSEGVEPLPVALSPRQHDGQQFRDVPGACDPLLVARAARSVFRLRDHWRGRVAARAEVEGDSSSRVAARGLDDRRGHIVRREALASVLGDAVAVNIPYSHPSWRPGR